MFKRLMDRVRGALASDREWTEVWIREGYKRNAGKSLDEHIKVVGINPQQLVPVFDDLHLRFGANMKSEDVAVCRPAATQALVSLVRSIDILAFEAEQQRLRG